MCRLYGLRSTHPTRVGCELIDAQNSLIQQSRKDERGLANPHGWGIGFSRDGELTCKRQATPASESEDFRRTATEISAPALVAHVRRATVGNPKLVNTHPFHDEHALLAHNGHIDHFDEVRERMLEETTDERRAAIQGETDSEHFFHFLQSLRSRHPNATRRHVLRDAIRRVRGWARDIDPEAEVSLNVLWIEENDLAGARYGRTLWYIERHQPHICEICGKPHADPDPDDPYHVVEFASERLTSEGWTEVPEGITFDIGPDRDFDIAHIDT